MEYSQKTQGHSTVNVVKPDKVKPKAKSKGKRDAVLIEPTEAVFSEDKTSLPGKLTDSEIKEIENLLKKKGVPEAELNTILAQMRELDRELADELLRSFIETEGEK